MARADPQLKLRLPEDTKRKVAESAIRNNRSINAEIVSRLERTFRIDEEQAGAAKRFYRGEAMFDVPPPRDEDDYGPARTVSGSDDSSSDELVKQFEQDMRKASERVISKYARRFRGQWRAAPKAEKFDHYIVAPQQDEDDD